MNAHIHAYELCPDPMLAYFSKRGTFFDARWYSGRVEHCACGKWRFVPEGAGLRPVEAEPVQQEAA